MPCFSSMVLLCYRPYLGFEVVRRPKRSRTSATAIMCAHLQVVHHVSWNSCAFSDFLPSSSRAKHLSPPTKSDHKCFFLFLFYQTSPRFRHNISNTTVPHRNLGVWPLSSDPDQESACPRRRKGGGKRKIRFSFGLNPCHFLLACFSLSEKRIQSKRIQREEDRQ